MTAAAQTPDLTDRFTGKDCLLAVARWLVVVLLLRWLIARGTRIAARLHHPSVATDLARITRGLRRAAALEAELLATGPTDRRMAEIAHRRAIAAEIIDICRDLGVFRGRPCGAVPKNVRRRVFHRSRPAATLRRGQARPAIPSRATGPPYPHRAAHAQAETRVCPWNFSRRAPASFFVRRVSA